MKKYLSLFLCVMLTLALAACSTIELDMETLDLKLGETGQITPDTKDIPVTYQSSDTSVVTVDENGSITTVGIGTATVTAANSKNKTAECVVNVSHVEPTDISLSETDWTLTPEETGKLIVTLFPENATNREVTFTSSNEIIAIVDQEGMITGISAGTAVITATTTNGKTATCEVTVPPYAENITIDAAIDLLVKDKSTLSVTYTPENCVAEEIIWTSSDESVATVNNGKVTAVGAGTATITAESARTHLTASCAVTVGYAELTITSFNSGGYSSSVMATTNMGSYFKKEIGFKPTAVAAGGSGNYQYKFDVIKNGSVVKTSGWQSSASSEFTFSSGGTYTARVTVRDSIGQTATASETVTMS